MKITIKIGTIKIKAIKELMIDLFEHVATLNEILEKKKKKKELIELIYGGVDIALLAYVGLGLVEVEENMVLRK